MQILIFWFKTFVLGVWPPSSARAQTISLLYLYFSHSLLGGLNIDIMSTPIFPLFLPPASVLPVRPEGYVMPYALLNFYAVDIGNGIAICFPPYLDYFSVNVSMIFVEYLILPVSVLRR